MDICVSQCHGIFSKACGNLIEKHFFKPSDAGEAHNLFKRYLAAHLLQDGNICHSCQLFKVVYVIRCHVRDLFLRIKGTRPKIFFVV